MAEAMRLTGKKTKTELVNHALEQLVSRLLRRRALLDLEGKVEWSGDLDRTRETRAL